MTILVTGSSGYIGSELVATLRQDGATVIGLDRRPPSSEVEPDLFVHADILDAGSLESALVGVDMVFHLAAAKDDWGLSRRDYFRDNLHATARLLSVGRGAGINRWVFYSTVGVLGSGTLARGEDAPYNPETLYAASKMEAELLFASYAREDPSASIAVIRPSAVFSPENPANNNIYRLIQAIDRGRFAMVGDGHELKSTSYLHNLLSATVFIYKRMTAGIETYHYVDEPAWSTRQLVAEIHALLGRRPPRLFIPNMLATTAAAVLDVTATLLRTDIPITGARIRKFCTATNFSREKLSNLGFVAPFSMTEAIRASVLGHGAIGDARLNDRQSSRAA